MADPLATLDDVTQRLGLEQSAMSDTQIIRLLDLIKDASAAVRSEAGGQLISRATSTIRTSLCGRFALPQYPVVSVTSVTNYVGGAAISYVWDGLNTLDLYAGLDSWEIYTGIYGGYRPVANITYVHGYSPVPDDIIAIVSQMSGRAFGLPASDSGVTQESLGAYSVSYGVAAASGGVGFLPDERAIAQRYRRPRAPISML